MTPAEKKTVQEFKDNGAPGIAKIEDSNVAQFFKLYMTGHTYAEIAQITNKKKEIILYVSQRNEWHTKKMDYFNDLAIHFADKSRQSKLESANVVVQATAAFGKYISEEMQRFIKTGDKTIIENFDSKTFTNFIKSIETLDKLLGGGGNTGGAGIPKVDINLSGSEHKVKETSEGIEITTKAENGDTLSLLANYKKAKNS